MDRFWSHLSSPVGLACALVVVVALVDVLAGFHAALADLITAAPALAAAGGTRRQVLGVGAGGLTTALALALGNGVVSESDFAIAVVGIAGATAVAVLLTRRRELAEQRATWLISIVEQAGAATMSLDLGGRVTAWNDAAGRLLGHTSDEAIGRDVHDLVATSGPREVEQLLDRAENGLVMDEYESEWRRTDDREVPVVVSGFPLRSPSGEVVGVTVVATDRSEIQELETERDRLVQRVAQNDRLDSFGQLAGGIAHDFNNLLAVVKTYVGIAKDRTDDPRTRDDIDRIAGVADRAAALTHKLLAFSSATPQGTEVADVNEVFASLSDLLDRTLPANVALTAHLEPQVWPVAIDPTWAEQILVNLVLNARDALPEGGLITVETANEVVNGHLTSAPPTLPAGRYVRVAITDDGIGMTAEVRDHAFEPLFTTKAQGEGTGFGLATVYGICRQAGGLASIYSEPGEGTTVKLFLPAVEGREPTAEPEVAESPDATPAGQRVLLVEDTEMLREPLELALREAGYDVMSAPSAEAAIELLAGGRIDLLVSDVMMPGMSGPELADTLRRQDPGLPVLLLSGYTARTVGVAPSGGDYEFLEKPFDLDELFRKVATAIASR